MNKEQLIKEVSKKSGITQEGVRGMYEAMVEVIKDTTKSGEKVSLVGFLQFSTKDYPPRTMENPRTKEKVEVPATTKVKVKLSESF